MNLFSHHKYTEKHHRKIDCEKLPLNWHKTDIFIAIPFVICTFCDTLYQRLSIIFFVIVHSNCSFDIVNDKLIFRDTRKNRKILFYNCTKNICFKICWFCLCRKQTRRSFYQSWWYRFSNIFTCHQFWLF